MKFVLLLVLLVPLFSAAETFTTPLTLTQLDGAAFTASQNNRETTGAAKNGPREIIWTSDSRIEWQGVSFGHSTEPHPSHLRIGFTEAIPVGSVVVRGGGKLSILKATATYPGGLESEADWLPAERWQTTQVDRESYAIWVLPAGTTTRALRFSHTPELTDKDYAGWLGGCYVLPQRLANVAPQAVITTSRNPLSANRIINESSDKTWATWESVTNEQEAEAKQGPPISAEHPVWMQLTWPEPVKLSGLCGLFTGFSAAEVQATTLDPAKASPADWHAVTSATALDPLYPLAFGPNWIPFPEPITVRAVRLNITAVSKNTHPHMQGKPLDGRRVWLAELMALHPLGADALNSITRTPPSETSHPPIAIPLKLAKPGHVTLVIENANKQRVRNLIADTPLPAGEQTIWWDGLDDLGRDVEAARHGIYHVPGTLVPAGAYTVRGLIHEGFDLRYEFPIYTAGTPAWNTEDHTGAWLSNHTPPQAALYVPADRSPVGQEVIYLGSYVSEGTHGLAWVDLDGKKLGGMNWVGGNWTGAPYLACDRGAQFVKDRAVLTGSVWPVDREAKPVQLELRLNAITKDGPKQVLKQTWPAAGVGGKGEDLTLGELTGLAAHDGKLAVSLGRRGLVLMIDLSNGSVLSETKFPDPRGLAFDGAGKLLILAATELRTLEGATVISHLENAQHLTIDVDGMIYISDHGNCHQVKVYAPDGKFLRAIGIPGPPQAGPYNPDHMNHPAGITLDSKHRLWVAEQDEQPKRVSVWTPEGKLQQAFYGPSEYGGGGKLDPEDKTKFYYRGMEFKLDWERGTSTLARVFHRPPPGGFDRPDGPHGISGFPESPVMIEGKRYFTNCYNSNPTGGTSVAMLWWDRDPKQSVVPVAAMGRANDWPLLATPEFRKAWPQGVNPLGDRGKEQTFFIWMDANGNGRPDADEFEMRRAQTGGVTVLPDGTFVVSRLEDQQHTMSFFPAVFDPAGRPDYRLFRYSSSAEYAHPPASSGGDQALTFGKQAFLTLGLWPYHSHSLSGALDGQTNWSYPNLWPGLHASHEAAMPEFSGEIIGVTRLLGDMVATPDPNVGPVCFLNGNMGPIYVFTTDGLFVTQLFQDVRLGAPWSMPRAIRGMKLNNVTPHDENFWPSVTRTKEGEVYLVDGGRSSLIHVTGWEQLHALPPQTLTLTEKDVTAATKWQAERESLRQKQQGQATLAITQQDTPPTAETWKAAAWAIIDQRGIRANFNSNSKPYDVQAALALTNDRIYANFKTGDPKLLTNSGENSTAWFKTGGALDLMLQTDLGDIRVLVTQIKQQPKAMLYRSKAPGTKPEARIPFSSPHRTIYFDQVTEITTDLEFTADQNGNFQFSLPRQVLGLTKPPSRGDLGVLRGDGQSTTARVYWSNKATAITADVPSEAELQPLLWGKFLLGE